MQYLTGGEPIVLTDNGDAPERGRRLGGAGDRGDLER